MGVAAFLPVMYLLSFGYYSTSQIFKVYDMAEKGVLPQDPAFLNWVLFLGILLFLVTLGVFIIDVFKNNKIKDSMKAVWVITTIGRQYNRNAYLLVFIYMEKWKTEVKNLLRHAIYNIPYRDQGSVHSPYLRFNLIK